MSFRLKSATVAAFTLAALAAVTASDASKASSVADSNTPVTIRTPVRDSAQAPVQAEASAVTFAARQEVVQPLTSSPTIPQTALGSGDSQPAASLAALVESHGDPETLDDEMRCLAGAVYYESKGESLAGQLAVARVIINRAESGRFASSLCGVVTQRGQFSFVRGKIVPQPPVASRDWREAVAIAQIAMSDSWDSPAEGALFFHARRVSPNWGKKQFASIDNHIFYR